MSTRCVPTIVLSLALALLLSACASPIQSWHADPGKGDYPVRLTNWPAVSLTVVDGRSVPPRAVRIRSTAEQLLLPVWLPPEDVEWTEHSQAVVGEIQRALVEALGGRVTGDSPLALRVTIVTHEARFDNGTWSGITGLSAQALRGGQPTGMEATSTKRVDRHNWWGYGTARGVLRDSLSPRSPPASPTSTRRHRQARDTSPR